MGKASYTLPTVAKNTENYQFINDLTGGWKAIIQGAQKYLPLQMSETTNQDKQFKARLELATYLDSFNPTIEGLLGLIFQKEIIIESEQLEILDFKESADLLRKDLNKVIKTYFNTALRKGLAFAYVDIPATNGDIKLDKERVDLGIKPFVILIEPENVINWHPETIRGKQVLTQVTIREFVEKPLEGDRFEVETVTQYRVLTIGGFEVFDDTDTLIESGATGLNVIPLVSLNLDENGGFFDAKPPFLDLGYLSIANYQMMSDSRWSANTASIPVLGFYGFGSEEVKKVEISVNKGFITSNPDAKAEYLDYEGKGVGVNLTLIEKNDKRIAEIGMSVISENKAEVTATEKTLDTIQTQSKLSNWVDSLEKSTEEILNLVMMYFNSEFNGTIDISADILDQGLTADEMAKYIDMVAKGLLSNITLWQVMKIKGRLPKDFNDKEEEERIKNENTLLETQTLEV